MKEKILLIVLKLKHIIWSIIMKEFPDFYNSIINCSKLNFKYAKRNYIPTEKAELWLYKRISSGEPFMVSRFGAVELSIMRTFEFNIKKNYDKVLKQANICAGIFPYDEIIAEKFILEYMQACKQIDGIAIWRLEAETYYINKCTNKDIKCFPINVLQPWQNVNAWSMALKGKKVLVIHPFTETIKKQYCKREKLFEEKDVLPEFELFTIKAVQTAGGGKDERFSDWFEALAYMKQEIDKVEFDIAILGCGAYGMPLAAYIKTLGKQAIHMGGISQLLFGIKGNRWNEIKEINCFYNDFWTYPDENEKPKKANNVEESAYWGV